MKIKIGLGILFLILLQSCSDNSGIKVISPTVVNASESSPKSQMLPIAAQAKIAGEIIELEVARTPQQQALGLMFRESLPDNRGMLFPFESKRITRFWMKNVPVSLDMIFINGDRIVDVANNVPPCQSEPCPVYGPDSLVDSVIELRAGRSQELGINKGDLVQIELLAPP